MKKRYDYFWARAATQITGIVFLSQLALEVSGVIIREPGLEWVIYACGAAFAASVLYSVTLIALNARKSA
jgi:hypothetical protein